MTYCRESDHPRCRDASVDIHTGSWRIELEILPPFSSGPMSFAQFRTVQFYIRPLITLLKDKEFFLFWSPLFNHHVGDLEIRLGDPRERRYNEKVFAWYGFTEEDARWVARRMDLLRPFGKPSRDLSWDEGSRTHCDSSFRQLESVTGKSFWIPRHMKGLTQGRLSVVDISSDTDSKSRLHCKYSFGTDASCEPSDAQFSVFAEGKPHELPSVLRKLVKKEAKDRGISIHNLR